MPSVVILAKDVRVRRALLKELAGVGDVDVRAPAAARLRPQALDGYAVAVVDLEDEDADGLVRLLCTAAPRLRLIGLSRGPSRRLAELWQMFEYPVTEGIVRAAVRSAG